MYPSSNSHPGPHKSALQTAPRSVQPFAGISPLCLRSPKQLVPGNPFLEEIMVISFTMRIDHYVSTVLVVASRGTVTNTHSKVIMNIGL